MHGGAVSGAGNVVSPLGGMIATRLALLRAIRGGDLVEARRVLSVQSADDLGDPIDALIETVGVYQEELRLQSEELQLSRARAEAASARLQHVFEQLPVPAVLLDRGGAIVDANHAAVRRFGLDLRTGRAHLLRRYVAADAAYRVSEALAEARLVGQTLLSDLPLALPDDRSGVADLYVTPLESGTDQVRETFLCVLVDHTAQRELSSQLDLAVRAGGVGVWDLDVLSRQAHLSAIMQSHLGFATADVALEDWLARLHPDDARQAGDDLARAMVHTASYQSEYRVVHPDGTVRVLHILGAVQRNAAGRPVRARGVSHDVTAERMAEQQQRARDLAERANQAKSEFLSRMSHELRTPLNAIIGFAQLLDASGDPQSAKQRSHVKQIEAAGWHLVHLVNDLLDLSRIESGHTELRLEPVDLGPALQAAAQIARSAVKIHRDITVEIESQPALRVHADDTRLKQVLVNLISNAIKYNRDRGHVRIDVHVQEAWVSIVVRDTGPGIAPAQVARMFEPFNRLGASTDVEGTGLGLSIAHRLAGLMRGQLTATSVQGEGSSFTLRLPLAAPAASSPSALPIDIDLDGEGSIDVLYVEDNLANAELMREVLSLVPGCTLRLARDAGEALAQWTAKRAHLLLVDVNLPGESGLDLVTRLRARDGHLPPWIAVTADVMPATEQAVKSAGAIALWRKPIDVAEVLAELDRQRTALQQASPAAARVA
jgi:signal transduction histidine kinase/ActR/RegA family two-component response regulator